MSRGAFKKLADLEKPAEIGIIFQAPDEYVELILHRDTLFVCYLCVRWVSASFSGRDPDRPQTNRISWIAGTAVAPACRLHRIAHGIGRSRP